MRELIRSSWCSFTMLLLTIALVSSLEARAQSVAPAGTSPEDYGTGSVGNVGLLAGVGFLNNGGGNGFTYGLNGNWMISHPFQMGVQFNTLQPSSTVVGGNTYTNTLTNIDVTLRWVPTETAQGLKLGGVAGMAILSLGAPGQSSTVKFAYGVTGVYDFMLSNRWSLGPQIDYLWNSDSSGYDDLNIFATARYWF